MILAIGKGKRDVETASSRNNVAVPLIGLSKNQRRVLYMYTTVYLMTSD